VNEEPFIYPNPSDGEFTVVADPLAFNAYLVIDLAGRTMLSGNITSAKTRISLGGSQGGLYQLVLKGKSGSLSKNLLLAY
ncbi:MAG: T9SS type A sorting domain-containing protein, partial [Sphingobacteriales bacterium]